MNNPGAPLLSPGLGKSMTTDPKNEPNPVRPEGDAPDLAELLDLPAIQALMEDFHALENIGLAIVDLHGNVLAAAGWQDICTQFHRVHPDTRRHCLESDTALSSSIAPGESKLYRCRNGLWDMATPIVVGERHAGNFFLGQFFFDDEEVDIDTFRAQARRYGFDEAAYLAALERVPRWSRDKIHRAMAYYARFAKLISELGLRNLQLRQTLDEQRQTKAELGKSEARYRSVLNASPDIITIADLEGRILMVSASALTMLGYKREDQLVGRPVFDFIVPEDRERAAADMVRMLQNPTPTTDEYRALRADGSSFDIEVNGETIRDDSGQPRQMLLVIRNISERRRTEDKLRISIEQYRDIAANIPGVIYQLQSLRTGALEVTYMSAGCETLFERPLGERTYSALLFDHMHVGDRALFQHSMAAAARAQQGWSLEFRILRPDGRPKWLRGSANPRTLASGAIAWNGVLLDIDALKQAEEARRESEAFQHRLMEAIPIPVFYKDRQGRFQVFNKAFESFFGRPGSELTGKTVFDLLPKKRAQSHHDRDLELIEQPGTQTYESQFQIGQGPLRTVVVHKASIADSRGAVIGIIGTFHDITDRKEDEKRMADQIEELRRWQAVILGREDRIARLKREVNVLAARLGQPPPYASEEAPS